MRTLGAAVTLLLLLITLAGCGQASVDASADTLQDEVLSFASDERWEEHWLKHGMNPSEFNPVLTKDEYLQRARAFFAAEAPDIEEKDRDGDLLRYRHSTNEFGVLSEDRVIRTYFIPSSGVRYWQRQ
jgi:pyocin large subunit-like protein